MKIHVAPEARAPVDLLGLVVIEQSGGDILEGADGSEDALLDEQLLELRGREEAAQNLERVFVGSADGSGREDHQGARAVGAEMLAFAELDEFHFDLLELLGVGFNRDVEVAAAADELGGVHSGRLMNLRTPTDCSGGMPYSSKP